MKTKFIMIVLIFLALSRTFSLSYKWELKDAIAQSMSENMLLKQKHIDLNQKKLAKDRNWNLLLPDLSASILVSNDLIPDSSVLSGRLGASLKLKGTLPYQFKNLQYLYETERISYEQAIQLNIRDIKDFFYQILLVKEQISLAKEDLALVEQQYEKTSLLFDSGMASDLDLMALKVNLANSRPELMTLKNDYASKMFQLKYLTGLKPDDDLELTGSIVFPKDIISLEELFKLVPDNPDLRKLKEQNMILENDRKIAVIQNSVPSLSLEYSYSPRINQPFAESFTASDSWSNPGSLSISMSLPLDSLLPGSAGRVGLESIDAEISKGQLAFSQLLYTSDMDRSNLINQLAGIRETLDARILAVNYSREAYDYTLKSYNEGGVDIQELQRSETDLQKARVAVLTETYNYISKIFDLEYLLGIEIIKE